MLIIIDSNALCYSSFFKTGALRNGEEKTGIIYGFLRSIYGIKKKYSDSIIAFAWDSRISLRKAIYPEYKEGRDHSALDDEDYAQFNMLRTEILPIIGFENIYHRDGYEADDFIALLCLLHPKEDKIIVTSDEDMYQCLDAHTAMLKPKKMKLYKLEDFEREWGIHPSKWAEVKAIAGCNTDNVKGMVNVGNKTAVKMLLGESKKAVDKVIYKRNLPLVKLPYSKLRIRIPTKDIFNLREFRMLCYRFGFDSLLPEIFQWKKIF